MKECSKSIVRRSMSPNFMKKYFSGHGLDIGGKPDPLALYTEIFPLIKSIKTWDLEDGDAQYLADVSNDSYDFIHSSHCLEHLHDPKQGLENWFRVLRPGGFLVVTVPDEDLYEQGVFPSNFNLDHKWTFSIYKHKSWSDKSINILDLVTALGEHADVEKIELLNSSYRYQLPRYDQTLTPIGECAIELVIRKRGLNEAGHEKPALPKKLGDREMRIHFNQYRDDMASMKSSNTSRPPFTNDSDL